MTLATTIERIREPSPTAFRQRWLEPGLPTVIEGVADAWSARWLWTADYLVDRYGETEVTVVRLASGLATGTPDQGVPLHRMRLADAAASWASTPTYYVATGTRDLPASMLAEFELPRLCQRPLWGRSKFWFGPAATVTTMHQDANENLMVQLRGRKRFLLYPPSERRNLYAYPLWSRTPNFSPVDPTRPDYDRHPRLARTSPMEVILEEGQSLFIPRFWWHHVTSLDPAIGLNFWWSSGLRAVRSIAWDGLFVLRGHYR